MDGFRSPFGEVSLVPPAASANIRSVHIHFQHEGRVMGKGNNSQGKEKKKPKKGAAPAPVKSPAKPSTPKK